MQPQDQGFLSYVTGLIVAVAGGVWALLRDIYRRIDTAGRDAAKATAAARVEAATATGAARTQAEEGDKALWLVVNQEREIARQHRESVLTRIGELPTKGDLTTMESRLMAAISKDKV
ncbi:MAG: hypothetical protein KGH75_09325 [Rhodospirillales bacterium]|nr:hypothetical protein [Rhodospirillales bacterium]